MKHQKEWHTCDRCSVEIEYNYSAVANIEVEKQSYSLGICGVIYKRKTQRESNSFDLCPKCKRDNPNWKPLTKQQFIELYKQLPDRTNINIGELLEKAIIDGIMEEL